jgi:hypothetical protein
MHAALSSNVLEASAATCSSLEIIREAMPHLLTKHLRINIATRVEAAAAVKSVCIACDLISAAPQLVSAALLPAAPLFISHLGGGYGPDLVLLCAWAIAGLAEASDVDSAARTPTQTLIAQGATQALLAAGAAGAVSGSSAGADASATCMLALTRILASCAQPHILGAPRLGPDAPLSALKIANTLLAASPPLGRVASSALAQRHSGALAVEAAWLCAEVVATGTPAAAQLAGAATWPQVHQATVDAAAEVCVLWTEEGPGDTEKGSQVAEWPGGNGKDDDMLGAAHNPPRRYTS